jgi:hypothetical protein
LGGTRSKEFWTVIETLQVSVDRFVVDISKVGKHVYVSLNDAREESLSEPTSRVNLLNGQKQGVEET